MGDRPKPLGVLEERLTCLRHAGKNKELDRTNETNKKTVGFKSAVFCIYLYINESSKRVE